MVILFVLLCFVVFVCWHSKASAVPLSRNAGPVLTILENISVCGVQGSDDGMKILNKTKTP